MKLAVQRLDARWEDTMNPSVNVAPLLQGFFTTRLMQQKQASPDAVGSLSGHLRLLLKFPVSQGYGRHLLFCISSISTHRPITAFLHELEEEYGISARTRNLRPSAIRSFFRYVAFEVPSQAAHIQQVLAIPGKPWRESSSISWTRPRPRRCSRLPTWRRRGRRDHALILLALQTGLRFPNSSA